jgi:hypothetical protein
MFLKKTIQSVRMIFWLLLLSAVAPGAQAGTLPFGPGEKLEYVLRWENVPAGSATLKILPQTRMNGEEALHFIMTVNSNRFVDLFFKVRNQIDAFSDLKMTRSLYYRKNQKEGRHVREEEIRFDWRINQAWYANFGSQREPIRVEEGSFDPLTALYFIRMAPLVPGREIIRPITDGKKNITGRLFVHGRETITLQDGRQFDTYRVEPDISDIGGVFKKSDDARIDLWLTADSRRIPVRIKSRVVIGSFIGELVSAEWAGDNGEPM